MLSDILTFTIGAITGGAITAMIMCFMFINKE